MPTATLITEQLQTRELEAWRELQEMSNWGRWGADDELGAFHYVDLAAIRRGYDTIKIGKIYSLADEIHESAAPRRTSKPPNRLFLTLDGGDFAAGAGGGQGGGIARRGVPGGAFGAGSDVLMMGIHATATHVDALCHYWTNGQLYNGFSSNVVHSYGASKLGMENLPGIVTRGILLDMPKFRGVDVCDPFDYFTGEDVLACCEAEGVTIQKGDAVLFHTGISALWKTDPERWNGYQPGVGASAGLVLAKKEICLLGADNLGVGPAPPRWPREGDPENDPRAGLGDLHHAYLGKLGIYLLEMMNMTELARDGVYEFLFCLAPLRIKGATGSPVNPLAVA